MFCKCVFEPTTHGTDIDVEISRQNGESGIYGDSTSVLGDCSSPNPDTPGEIRFLFANFNGGFCWDPTGSESLILQTGGWPSTISGCWSNAGLHQQIDSKPILGNVFLLPIKPVGTTLYNSQPTGCWALLTFTGPSVGFLVTEMKYDYTDDSRS